MGRRINVACSRSREATAGRTKWGNRSSTWAGSGLQAAERATGPLEKGCAANTTSAAAVLEPLRLLTENVFDGPTGASTYGGPVRTGRRELGGVADESKTEVVI